jgi:hypothetical protein
MMKNQLLVARSLGRTLRRAALALGFCAAAFASLAAATPARASDSQFMGLWFNMDSATRGIVRFQILGSPGALGVHVYGACSPTACDWSVAKLTTYGDNVSDTDHKYATAVYDFGFATTTLTFQLIDPATIVVNTYTKFNDGSGRQDYHDREIFRKLLIDPIPFPRR